MSSCRKCGIGIRDESKVCPLCGAPLEMGDTAHETSGYPDVSPSIKKMQLAIKIIIFSSVVAEIVMIIVNIFTKSDYPWSALAGVGLVFGCFTFAFSFRNNRSLQRKLVIETFATVIVIFVVNAVVGYGSWGLTIGAPAAVAAFDIALVCLMLSEIRHYRLYIFGQVFMVALSVILAIVCLVRKESFYWVCVGTAMFTIIVLAGMIVFGGRQATGELKRRFRV